MRTGIIQFLPAALLAAGLLASAGLGETGEAAGPEPTVTLTPTPLPSPTPRKIPVALYFRRPATIIPIYREEGEAEVSSPDFEVADHTPWLTDRDIRGYGHWPDQYPDYLQVYLTPKGVNIFGEAIMGNFGRMVILAIDGTVRAVVPVENIRTRRADRLDFSGSFTPREVEKMQLQVASRPAGTPTPAPSPTPARRERFIIR